MLHRWSIFIILAALFSSGCRSTPPPTVTVIPVPTFTPTPAPAMTITATITATAPLSTSVESAREPSADTPLPAPLYFLNQQGQIMRLEADGVTVQPITSEDAPITAFDVDPTGAYLVYISNNDLIRTNAWGQERHLLLAGGRPQQQAQRRNGKITCATLLLRQTAKESPLSRMASNSSVISACLSQ